MERPSTYLVSVHILQHEPVCVCVHVCVCVCVYVCVCVRESVCVWGGGGGEECV